MLMHIVTRAPWRSVHLDYDAYAYNVSWQLVQYNHSADQSSTVSAHKEQMLLVQSSIDTHTTVL